MNFKRYEYLKDDSGNFYNPYDRGFIQNWLEFFGRIPPLKLGLDNSKHGELYSV